MAVTYDKIATSTVSGSSTTNVEFTSIPGTYTDLILVASFSMSANDEFLITFNSDSGTNYSRTYIIGDGSTTSSVRNTNTNYIAALGRNYWMQNIVHIFNYASTNVYKTALIRTDAASTLTGAIVGLWRNTAAITTVKAALLNSKTYTSGSMLTLYGVKAA